MAYIGNTPAESFASFEKQVFTIVNSQTAYTLSHSVVNENDIRLVVNNVVQEPGSGKAYTASGTTLTLSAALVNGTDEMYCVYLGKTVGTVSPASDSVTTAMIQSNAVNNAKMADDAIGLAELSATGTASSSTFLRGDNSWASAGGNMLPAFYATATATRSIADSTDVVLTYNTEVWDSGGCFDTSTGKFTPTTAGKYFLFSSMRWDTDTDFQISYLKLFKNLTNTAQDGFPNDYYNFYYTATIVEANGSSDYFLTKAQQNSGSAKNLSSSSYGNFFGGWKIIE